MGVRWGWCGGVRVCIMLCTDSGIDSDLWAVAQCVWRLWRDGCNDSDVKLQWCRGYVHVNAIMWVR